MSIRKCVCHDKGHNDDNLIAVLPSAYSSRYDDPIDHPSRVAWYCPPGWSRREIRRETSERSNQPRSSSKGGAAMPTVTGHCDRCARDTYGKARTCRFCQNDQPSNETDNQEPMTATVSQAEEPSGQGEPEEDRAVAADQTPPTSAEARALIDLFAEFDNSTSIRQLRLGLSWTFPKTIKTLKANPHLFRQTGKTKWEYSEQA